MDFIGRNIWLLIFMLWGLPLGYYRSKFRKLVYETNNWTINIKPVFGTEIKGLVGNIFPENKQYLKFRNFYRFYLLVYLVLFAAYLNPASVQAITLYDIALILVSYLVGSIPVGYLLTSYTTGKNIMQHGSGNIGSTNVKRIAGKKVALVTQLLDMLKGLLPVLAFKYLDDTTGSDSQHLVYFVALAAIIGHDFSIFLRFKGGKGVNTTLGASVLLAPYAVFVSVAFYFIVKWRFRFVSLGSLALAVSLPLSTLIIDGLTPTCYYLTACSVLIILLHWENIQRLIQHRELPSN